ncbi:hypothetical protein MSP8886_04033 [Marinomonas spartinae]|uniref:N-acetyltransferase domain-containing protein n=1 Tax=Marinomonas spartinae TaxID=1792290 RepID=A0A1A8TTU6_9GAMM|nr:GNAT family N-acetyltransferase [Marinomonas spartinae]SBS37228.1 hypothetical protein MSP8886_04033 [Marinomonas spartinae]
MSSLFSLPVRVPSLWFPLVKKFYQAHYPSGKPNKADPIWVIKQQGRILSAVRLKQLDRCQLLTAMVTEPGHRGLGIGHHLLRHLHKPLAERPCYCFALSHLERFYQDNGFHTIDSSQLPDELLGRLTSYVAQGRALIPMHYIAKRSEES